MKPEVAKQLIEEGVEHTNTKQVWADLGAGNGLFTNALSMLLSNDSIIYAIDSNATDLSMINIMPHITLKKIQGDFVHDDWTTEPLTGVLLANALHFVKEKESFLKRIKEKLTLGGRLVIVEYEMEHANNWVPYPIEFNRLRDVVNRAGFSTIIKKLKEVPSVYENRMIYSAVIG